MGVTVVSTNNHSNALVVRLDADGVLVVDVQLGKVSKLDPTIVLSVINTGRLAALLGPKEVNDAILDVLDNACDGLVGVVVVVVFACG